MTSSTRLSPLSAARVVFAVCAITGCATHSSRASRAAEVAPGRDPIAAVEAGLLERTRLSDAAPRSFSLADRMAFHEVPAVSIAVVDGGRIAWARAYGLADREASRPADTSTVFQAGSISKTVTAIAALRLAGRGMLSPDVDVNQLLRSWKLPANRFTMSRPVTLRDVLAHRAGLTTCCFKGYPLDQPFPTIEQTLDGAPPANTAPIRVDTTPGAIWRYSGGGYVLAQRLMMDVTGSDFDPLVRTQLFEPTGMRSSTFDQRLPDALRPRAALGYARSGAPIRGGWYAVPEMAAGGLWTTASDLARVIIAMQQSIAGERGAILSPPSVTEMLTPGPGNWGLGVELRNAGDSTFFTHSGGTEGYRSILVGFTRRGQGIAVLTNSDNGDQLIGEIVRAVAKVYQWPAFPQRVRAALPPDARSARAAAGRYRIVTDAETIDVEIAADAAGTPRARIPVWGGWRGWRAMQLAAPDRYFFREHSAEVQLIRSGDGSVSELRLEGFSQPYRARRVQ